MVAMMWFYCAKVDDPAREKRTEEVGEWTDELMNGASKGSGQLQNDMYPHFRMDLGTIRYDELRPYSTLSPCRLDAVKDVSCHPGFEVTISRIPNAKE
jgi:hypothetical protein